MADDAFALSPISARAAQPSEADYDAIQEAFMETARGRWFLGEYAKRNRNADTRMVLDAVARIEDTLAAQKKPERDPLLDQALTALRAALTQAREAAQTAVSDLALDQNLAPVRKGVRIIREISWRWREIGGDGRICDLIDSQIGAMEAATERMAPADLANALSGAFDGIEKKIAAFDAGATPAARQPAAEPTPQTADVAPAAMAQADIPAEQAAAANDAAYDTMPATSATHEAEVAGASHQPPVATANEAPQAAAEHEPFDAFDSHDEALLDMVAMEMAAPDSDAAYEPKLDDAQIHEDEVHGSQIHAGQIDGPNGAVHAPVASYEIDVTFPEASGTNDTPATASTLPLVTPLQSLAAPEAEPISVPQPAPEPVLPAAEPALSLGSSLIANGIVPRPRASRPDPLAPIRRMSQTEKIAFFS